jgi:hypothetical protein
MKCFDGQNDSNMYIAINKTTDESAIFKEKTQLSTFIGKSLSTITRNKNLKQWETSKFLIYNSKIVQIKSNRGGKTNFTGKNESF